MMVVGRERPEQEQAKARAPGLNLGPAVEAALGSSHIHEREHRGMGIDGQGRLTVCFSFRRVS